MLPSLEVNDGLGKKPRVLVLEIRDRNKTGRGVIAHLLVEHEERYDRYADGQLRQARIEKEHTVTQSLHHPPYSCRALMRRTCPDP